MLKPARSSLRNERGMTLVFVGIGLAAFVAATMLAIDVGMLMTARAQAQNSADAGAHGGAVALAFDDFDDRSANGPAVTNALREAHANLVMSAQVSVEPADVEFLNDPQGRPNRVKVTVYRTTARGNPLDLIMARVFGMNNSDIAATATAEASPADMPNRCFPFTIPDKWREVTDRPFNSETSYFDLYDNKKDPLPDPDVYVPVTGGDDYTGYRAEGAQNDIGSIVILKHDNDGKVSPGIYHPITIPGNGTGADRYREAISQGPCADFAWDSRIVPEPGNMVGPTQQGMEDLIAMDPTAEWDPVNRCINHVDETGQRSQCNDSASPRIGAIPLYDPDYYERNMQTGRFADFKVANFLSVFIEGMRGNEIAARIVRGSGRNSGRANMPDNMFLKAIRIVQ